MEPVGYEEGLLVEETHGLKNGQLEVSLVLFFCFESTTVSSTAHFLQRLGELGEACGCLLQTPSLRTPGKASVPQFLSCIVI